MEEIRFCKVCGRVAEKDGFCGGSCRKRHILKSTMPAKRGDYSGYSKWRDENGQYQAIWGR